jgi:flagellar motility protein MotE (MotC chaperone)
MADTAIQEALDCVRDAESAVASALVDPRWTHSQRALLCDLAETLRDLDAQLVLEDLKSRATAFEEKADRMISLNKETQDKLQDLQEVSETVGKVAKAMNALVKAVKLVV